MIAGAGLCTLFQLSHDILRRRSSVLRTGLSVIRILCLYSVFLLAFARLFSQFGDKIPSNIIEGIKKHSDKLHSPEHSHGHEHHSHGEHHHHHHHDEEEGAEVDEAPQDEVLSGDDMTFEEWLQQFSDEEDGGEASKYQENL